MNPQSFEALLDRAAALCGIEPEYWDIFGRHHVTTTEGKQAILRAMGWAAGSAEELEKSLADQARREWRATRAGNDGGDGSGRCRSALAPSRRKPGRRRDCHRAPRRRRDRDVFVSAQANFRRPGPSIWTAEPGCESASACRSVCRLGYHEIAVKCGAAEAATRYIAAPARAFTHPELARGGRAAGVDDRALRIALGAQLGLRRFPRSLERHRLGGGRSARQFRRPESAARHPQPAPV